MRFPDGIQRLGVLLLGASGLALAQPAQTPPPDSPPPRVMIRRGPLPHTAPQPQGPLLAFEIAAFDSRGAPIAQLALGDLRIYDDGRRMRPAFIRPVESAAPSVPLGPDEYSNRPKAALPAPPWCSSTARWRPGLSSLSRRSRIAARATGVLRQARLTPAAGAPAALRPRYPASRRTNSVSPSRKS